jgi:SecD/SecF fusion protein
MHTKQTGRVIFILFVLLAALFGIFQQPQNLFKPIPWSQKMMLRPGIDIAGGTSLLYQVKEPDGGFHSNAGKTLAEEMMAALKRRIDPDGVKNYIWRPQGESRLEIQIPASSENAAAAKAHDVYVKAQAALDAMNVHPQDVKDAVQNLTGTARDARLTELASGLPERTALFKQLAQKFDAMADAHAKNQLDQEAAASADFDKLMLQIDSTNIKVSQLEGILQRQPDDRKAALSDLQAKSAGNAARLAALNQFVSSYDAFHALKGSLDDAGQLKRDLKGSGVLEFHIAANPEELGEREYQRMVEQLHTKGSRPQAGDQVAWYQVDRPSGYHGRYELFDGKEFVLGWIITGKQMVNGPTIPQWSLEDARPTTELDGSRVLAFTFDSMGGKLFHEFTAANKGKSLMTILDRKMISDANINDAIGANGQISGDFSDDDLSYMVTTFKAGSLPGQLEDEPISEHTVGPSLGADNLRRGLYACVFGLVIVAIFLIGYYYLAGVVATLAVCMNVVLILGILSMFGATFTLPGIAGIVLTIGAAVDANVLIFERLREEQHLGLGIRMAMRNAYDHALSAILDSNATTVITSLILMWLGSEEVKGFGTTLLIGLLSSLFTSLFVTRTIFNVMIDDFHIKNLSSFPLTFPKWDALLKPDINWMKLCPIFWAISAIFIISGTVAFIEKARERELADVDFTSGTQVQFDLKAPMSLDQIRDTFAKANDPNLPSINLTGVGSESGEKDTGYELVTVNADAKAVRAAILNVMGDKIKTDLPSKFDHVNDPIEVATSSQTVQNVTPAFTLKELPDFKFSADDYVGGVAVLLRDINPPLKPDQIRDRLDRQKASERPPVGMETGVPALNNYTVISPSGPGVPTNTALVLTTDTDFPHDKDPAKWTANVAQPIWQLVKDAVDKEGQLQKVNTFGAQVAGDNQLSAFYALVLSSVVIMAYIWLRFGNLKYGTATVLAMIHDVALVIGAIGLSHYVAKIPVISTLLMVEPFRVNLTIVAAVLTVMSYSMIDTIVVFDRIRENRGKFGYLNKKVVNDSINQTLSRTLLTAGTNIVTVAGMYFVGGPGIHGFTFVLLIGILVGTYSSIAIAAPFLLLGSDVKKDAGRKGPPANQLQKVAA